ncbi:FAD-dependent oxidoreductase [Streptomyces sp. ACA25]|uniref:FAD-dependent oxidoreductase n=1 Tax=Streptomyces sp. ACA25 TaxID=3022596 RepID=UPI0023072000|nr:FAD-dependent oxidoreductase [Streptomyces sp. ACA25]MDB1090386.1 FAD-dependent oxidoreductase [Streptomyces sp. ACA25]
MVTAAGRAAGPAEGNEAGRPGRRAVVIGGSIAGLLAARVLADHCAHVTVLERDRLPEGAEHRPGVPHSRHTHVLLAGGQRALEELLPGVVTELRQAGAPRVGMPRDMVQWQAGSWYRRTAPTAHLLTPSRPLLEHMVRLRVLSDPRIEVVQGAEAVGLAGDAARITGVVVRERGGAPAAGRVREADLVVDASGRGSKAAGWLAGVGAEPPLEERLDTGLAYTTRLYRARPLGSADCLGYYVVPGPGQVYGAVVLPVEGDRILVTLSGLRGGEPPTDGEGFTRFAGRLPHPFVHDWLAGAEPLSPPHGFRRTADVRRRFEAPGRRPAGFLVTGDALCTVNPIYGQGMTVAALNALALRDALADRHRTPTTRRVQRALLRAAQQAWDISAGADKKMPGAMGSAAAIRAVDRPANWYLERVDRRAGGDPVVGAAFRSALSLSAPLTALFAPRVLRAVLLGPDPAGPADPPWQHEPE